MRVFARDTCSLLHSNESTLIQKGTENWALNNVCECVCDFELVIFCDSLCDRRALFLQLRVSVSAPITENRQNLFLLMIFYFYVNFFANTHETTTATIIAATKLTITAMMMATIHNTNECFACLRLNCLYAGFRLIRTKTMLIANNKNTKIEREIWWLLLLKWTENHNLHFATI